MKKLLYFILLLPLWVNAQTNGTIQKTSSTGTIRASFGSLGIDTLVNVNAPTNGYVPVYNSTLKKSVWTNPTSFTPAISFGTFGSTPNAQGGSYSGGIITLQPADATNPGGLSTGTQTIGGAKSLTEALSLIGTNSTLNFNRSVNTQSATQYFITNSIAKWRVGLTPTTDDNYHIKNETTATDALSIDNSTNVMTLSSLSAGGLVKSTSGALGIATAGTDYLTPTGSGSGLSGVVLTTGTQTIGGAKTFSSPVTFNGFTQHVNGNNSTIQSIDSGSGDFDIIPLNAVATTFKNVIFGVDRSGTGWPKGNVFVGYTADPTSGNKFAVNGNSYLGGTLISTGSISSTPQGTLYGTASGSITSAQLATSLTDETGTGSAVFSASPTFTGTVIAADMTTGDITTNANNKGMYFNGTRNAILGNNSTDEVTIVTANGVGSFLHGSTGDFTISGANATKASGTAWINPSDLRLKENLKPYKRGLPEILNMNPVIGNFNKASGFDTTKNHVWLIAQELQKIAPEMIVPYKGKLNGKQTDLLSIDGSDYTMMLINAIKDQQTIIDSEKKVSESRFELLLKQQEIIEKLNERITVLENK